MHVTTQLPLDGFPGNHNHHHDHHHQHHYHHHVHEVLGVFSIPWSSKWSRSLHLFLGRPMFLRPFGLYCSACFGILFLSIICTCCSQFFWHCLTSFTMFRAPVFPLIQWYFSLSNFLISRKSEWFFDTPSSNNILLKTSEWWILIIKFEMTKRTW